VFVEVLAEEALDQALQAGIESGVDHRFPGRVAQEVIGEMGGEKGRTAAAESGDLLAGQDSERGLVWMAFVPGQGQPPSRLLLLGIEIPPLGRLLRHHRQGQAFGQGQVAGLLAKIEPGRRPHPFDVAAHGGQVAVGLEQRSLGVTGLQPEGQRYLADLAGKGAGMEVEKPPGQLHGQGGATLAFAPAVGGPGGTRQGQGVDPRMPGKEAVLLEQDGGHGGGRHPLQRGP